MDQLNLNRTVLGLFDLGFKVSVTAWILRILYPLINLFNAFVLFLFLVWAFSVNPVLGVVLLFVDAIEVLLVLLISRVIIEQFMIGPLLAERSAMIVDHLAAIRKVLEKP